MIRRVGKKYYSYNAYQWEVRVDQVDEEGLCTWCSEEEKEASRHELQMDFKLKEYREGL